MHRWMLAIGLFVTVPLVLAAPYARSLLEEAPVPLEANEAAVSSGKSPAPEPGMEPVVMPNGSTMESDSTICEGHNKNAASFNFAIGNFSARILLDFVFPENFILQLFLADDFIKQRALNASPGAPTQAFINNLYVDTGKDRILVDAGLGPAGNGTLIEELKANAINPDSITKILLTHGHSDHISGLFMDANATIPSFPNAQYYVSKTEYEFWTAPNVNISGIGFPPDRQAVLINTAKTVFSAVRHPKYDMRSPGRAPDLCVFLNINKNWEQKCLFCRKVWSS
jgi:hypothetical protein